uniref:Uncharacterized protein n=1 Tax=Megaselia scalaris TaxID=36166 RepID=T1GH36_MEGSC
MTASIGSNGTILSLNDSNSSLGGGTVITYLKSNPKYKNIFAICGPIFREALVSNGFTIDDKPDETERFTLQTFTQNIIPTAPVDAVIIDIDLDMSLAKFCRGLLHAKNYPDCDIIVGATDNKIPLSKDVVIPGTQVLMDYIDITLERNLLSLENLENNWEIILWNCTTSHVLKGVYLLATICQQILVLQTHWDFKPYLFCRERIPMKI